MFEVIILLRKNQQILLSDNIFCQVFLKSAGERNARLGGKINDKIKTKGEFSYRIFPESPF